MMMMKMMMMLMTVKKKMMMIEHFPIKQSEDEGRGVNLASCCLKIINHVGYFSLTT